MQTPFGQNNISKYINASALNKAIDMAINPEDFHNNIREQLAHAGLPGVPEDVRELPLSQDAPVIEPGMEVPATVAEGFSHGGQTTDEKFLAMTHGVEAPENLDLPLNAEPLDEDNHITETDLFTEDAVAEPAQAVTRPETRESRLVMNRPVEPVELPATSERPAKNGKSRKWIAPTAGAAALLIAAGAYAGLRGNNEGNNADRAANTTPAATATQNPATTENAPTPDTSVSPTDIPSAISTETAPDVTGDSPVETAPKSEWGFESIVTADNLDSLVDEKAVEKLYGLYPVLKQVNTKDFVLSANPDAATNKSIAAYQTLLKKVYSAPELVPEIPTPSIFDETNFANMATDPGLRDINTHNIASYSFDQLFLESVFMKSGLSQKHLEDFADLATLDQTMRSGYLENLQQMESTGVEHARAEVSDVVVLGGFTDSKTDSTYALYAYKYKGHRNISISVMVPSGDFYSRMPRGIESAVSVPIWGRVLTEGQATIG